MDCCNEVEAVGRCAEGAALAPRRAKGELTLASIRIELLLDALDTLMLFLQKRQGGVFNGKNQSITAQRKERIRFSQ